MEVVMDTSRGPTGNPRLGSPPLGAPGIWRRCDLTAVGTRSRLGVGAMSDLTVHSPGVRP